MYESLNELLFIYLLIINILGFLLMGIDKKRAIDKKWRIPEKTLLIIGFIGGAFGTLLGMKAFRHKTKHKKFIILIPLAILLYAIGISYILVN